MKQCDVAGVIKESKIKTYAGRNKSRDGGQNGNQVQLLTRDRCHVGGQERIVAETISGIYRERDCGEGVEILTWVLGETSLSNARLGSWFVFCVFSVILSCNGFSPIPLSLLKGNGIVCVIQ